MLQTRTICARPSSVIVMAPRTVCLSRGTAHRTTHLALADAKHFSGVAHRAARVDEGINLLAVLVLDFAEPCVGSFDRPLPAEGRLVHAALDFGDAHGSGLYARLSFPCPLDGCDPVPSGHGFSCPFLSTYLFNGWAPTSEWTCAIWS